MARVRNFYSDQHTVPSPAVRDRDSLAQTKAGAMKVYGFPGQGSQMKGMGAALFEEFPDYVARADAVLGYSVRELCVENPDGGLRLTQFTQPA
jgi:trans-AT polyketide synthase, acyltransferase and oxidoreductase domains